RSTPILIVLLGASLLGNALLITRGSRRSEPAPESTVPSKGVSASSAERLRSEEAARLRESLEVEKKKNEELRLRVERLETDKKVLAQDGTPAPGRADKLAAFREKLRKLMKVMRDPAAKAGAINPDDMV